MGDSLFSFVDSFVAAKIGTWLNRDSERLRSCSNSRGIKASNLISQNPEMNWRRRHREVQLFCAMGGGNSKRQHVQRSINNRCKKYVSGIENKSKLYTERKKEKKIPKLTVWKKTLLSVSSSANSFLRTGCCLLAKMWFLNALKILQFYFVWCVCCS